MAEPTRAIALAQGLRDPADRANTLLRAALLTADEPKPYMALLEASAQAIAAIATPRQRTTANAILAVLRARGRQADASATLLATLGDSDRSKALLSIAFPRQQPLP
jgi:predicted hotdog family 3-hydroxylacyl-ACP dehydratase